MSGSDEYGGEVYHTTIENGNTRSESFIFEDLEEAARCLQGILGRKYGVGADIDISNRDSGTWVWRYDGDAHLEAYIWEKDVIESADDKLDYYFEHYPEQEAEA